MSTNSKNQDGKGCGSDDAGCKDVSRPSPSSNEPSGSLPFVGGTEEGKGKGKSLAGETDLKADAATSKGGALPPSSSERTTLAKRKKKGAIKIPLVIEVEETPSLYERIRQSEGSLVNSSLRTAQKRPRETDVESKGDEGRALPSDEHGPESKLSRTSEGAVTNQMQTSFSEPRLLRPVGGVVPVPGLSQEMISTGSDLLSGSPAPNSGCSPCVTGAEQPGRRPLSVLVQAAPRGEASASEPAGKTTVGSAPTELPGAGLGVGVGEVGGSNQHHFSFDYRGPHSIVADPVACEDMLNRIPEVPEGIPRSWLEGPMQSSGEIAAVRIWLMSQEHRREKERQRVVEELRQSVLLRDRVVKFHERETNKLKADLDEEKERIRAAESKLAAKVLKVGRLEMQVKRLREDLLCSDRALAEREAELDIRTRELAARAQELRDSEVKLRGMGLFCRRRAKRLLKDQLAAFRRSCSEQSENAVKTVSGHLTARGKWEAADRALSQARGAVQAAEGLRKDGVPVPDSSMACFVEEEAKCARERDALVVAGLTSESFEVDLPSDFGIPNLEQIDFSASLLSEDEGESESSGDSSDERGQGSQDEAQDTVGSGVRGSSSETLVVPPSPVQAELSDEGNGVSAMEPPAKSPEQERIVGTTAPSADDVPGEEVRPLAPKESGATLETVEAPSEAGLIAVTSGEDPAVKEMVPAAEAHEGGEGEPNV